MITALFARRHSLPIVLQSERAECGLACLAMVAGYFGYHTNLNALRQQFPVPARGAGLNDILNVAGALRLHSRALRLALEDIPKLQLPAILHWDMVHFVVLKRVGKKGIVIHDPAIGSKHCLWAEVGQHFTGVAVECMPAANFVKVRNTARSKINELFTRYPGFNSSVAQLFVLSLFMQIVTIVSAFYVQLVIDESIAKNDKDILVVLFFGFLLLVLINVAMTFFRNTVQLYFANQLGFQMVSNVFVQLMKLPVEFFSRRHVGDIVSRFSAVQEIRKILAEDMITVVLDGVFAIVSLTVLFYFNVTLSLVVLFFVLLTTIFKLALITPIKNLTESQIVAEASANSVLMENMRAIEVIKFYCRELPRIYSWRNRYARQINANVQLLRFGIRVELANGLLSGVEHLLVIYLAAMSVLDGNITLGFMTAFLALKANFSSSVSSFIDKIVQIRLVRLQLERLSDITCAEVEFNDLSLPSHARHWQGRLSVRDLSFRYVGSNEAMIDHIDLDVEPGEVVAITGASGVGKSTLLKIMAGLVIANEGQVLADDVCIKTIGVRQYRDSCAGVLQSDQLLSGTLLDNITLYDDVIDDERLVRAAKLAGIDDFIRRLPMGFNSLIGDMGSLMSAGQAQRILLARVFYKQAKILFLDEATANLDMAVEQKVLNAIRSLNTTTIMVSHRAAPLQMADRVFVLKNGQLQLDSGAAHS